MTAAPDKRPLYCGFCGGANTEREFMFAGDRPAFICSECVEAASVELARLRAAAPRRMTAADIGLEE